MNRRTDPWLITLTVLLVIIGLVMVYSASAVVAGETTGEQTTYVIRQTLGIASGLVLCVATAVTPMRVLRRYRKVLYAMAVIGLILCLVPGIQHRANGASRWIGVGSIHLQPSEFAKIIVLITLAHFLHRNRAFLADPRVLIRAGLIPLPIMALILMEPDFGTTAILGGLCSIMLVVAGARYRHMLVVAVGAVVVGVPLMLLEQYRVQRLTAFLRPWETMDKEGYHIIQSWIAMHSGGMWGQGLGNSIAKLHWLPEPWTDFIGAVIAEELGLVRLLCLIGLYSLLIWRGMHIAQRARDSFGMFLAATLTAMIGFEAFFNLAVVMGMVPPKGLVLPFISYGASAMQSHLWMIGILLSVAAEAEDVPVEQGWLRPSKPKSQAAK